ncbi:zinc finger protein [Kockovaella imperatae]|uniref:Zinc finger protein n=1 Tax=Kockovaella imperatae TaxID=4999 RepID=A0A1Y1UG52_9TREE|nr:zinc finger protein [Kockovaella imperatae]ORX37023.1 zinc finger protein [Kockovaella imperatae]
MCKHILNAQVSIRAPCCKKFFDCPECHAEKSDHPLAKTTEMAFICKKCRKAFRKDMEVFEESDEFCPWCDNHFVIEAKEAKPMIGVEGEDARIDSRMIKDDRVKGQAEKSLWNRTDEADKLDSRQQYQEQFR